MSNLPVPRPRWAIASTVGNEVEAQRVRSWLERKGISVRIQPVIVARDGQGQGQAPSAQIKIFVPGSDLRKAQAVLRDHHQRDNLRRIAKGQGWRYVQENQRLAISLGIIALLVILTLLVRAW